MATPPRPPRILLVDDDAVIRRRLRELLEQKEYVVDAVTNCREAIDCITRAAAEQPYRVAIIDVRLPDGHGIDVLKVAKRLTPETTCLMITGAPNEQAEASVRAAGADDFVVKPLLVDQLIDYMNRGGYFG